jgi:hypothetical protein
LTSEPQTPYTPKPIKVKIEFTDDSGTKYAFNIEGSSKENITKLIEFAQATSATTTSLEQDLTGTNFAKLYGLLETRFRFGAFTSTDVLHAYEQDFNSPTSLGVIATYLSRLTKRGMLTRSRHGSGWTYRLARSETQRREMITQSTPDELLRSGHIPP